MDKRAPFTDDTDAAETGEPITFTAEEIAGIEEAIADYELNGGIPYEDVRAWLDSLDTDMPLPEPQPSKFS